MKGRILQLWFRAVTVGADTFVWCPGVVPVDARIVQVYGWLLDSHGRVLVQRTPEGFNLPGGSPEPSDVDAQATLVREAMEESQVVVEDAVLLGYEQVLRPGRGTVALLRMAGRIAAFLPREPDVDGGRLLGRHMTSLHRACDLLGWGCSGSGQGAAVARVATHRWRLPVDTPSAPDADV